MMDDILYLCSIPDACGESGCPVGWHIVHYWIYDDGTYSACDADGNHEDVEESDVPTSEEQDRAWRAYLEHVAHSGRDPLGEFNVAREVVRGESWTFRLALSIGGLVVREAKRGRTPVAPADLPPHVLKYLDAEPRPRNHNVVRLRPTTEELTAAGVDWRKAVRCSLERRTPRSAAAVERDLRRAAQAALRNDRNRKG